MSIPAANPGADFAVNSPPPTSALAHPLAVSPDTDFWKQLPKLIDTNPWKQSPTRTLYHCPFNRYCYQPWRIPRQQLPTRAFYYRLFNGRCCQPLNWLRYPSDYQCRVTNFVTNPVNSIVPFFLPPQITTAAATRDLGANLVSKVGSGVGTVT